MPKKYHVDPESVGLHRLGHAELAHNGQRCGTCDHAEATGMHRSGVLCLIASSFPEIQREWKACAHYATHRRTITPHDSTDRRKALKAERRLQLLRQDMDYIHQGLEALEDNAMRFYQETNQHEMVKAFHKKFGVALPDAPTFDFPVDLRLNLIEEELDELKQAIVDENMPEFVDAVCDLLYVVHGIALAAGIQHIQPFMEEVHKTNLAKEGGKTRADGKHLKPEGWQPPRIAELLAEHYPEAV